MQKPTKTLKQINWSNGNTELCAPYGGGYSIWGGKRKFKNTIELVERMSAIGATVSTVENPDYDKMMAVWSVENADRVAVRRWNKMCREERRKAAFEEAEATRQFQEGVQRGEYPQWELLGSGM